MLSYPGLGDWVRRQRKGYKLMKVGRSNIFTTEKALKLAEIGFEFIVRPGRVKSRCRDLYNPHLNPTKSTSDDSDVSMDDEDEECSEDDEGDEDEEL